MKSEKTTIFVNRTQTAFNERGDLSGLFRQAAQDSLLIDPSAEMLGACLSSGFSLLSRFQQMGHKISGKDGDLLNSPFDYGLAISRSRLKQDKAEFFFLVESLAEALRQCCTFLPPGAVINLFLEEAEQPKPATKIEIVSMPDRRTETVIERGHDHQIKSSVQIESDAH